ncbi:MAG: hypothetical protein LKI28_07335 [Ancrocorticia sp.]|jgi:hypothetical protein|nr:hypothetical protein [Ancrocorticia sp.]
MVNPVLCFAGQGRTRQCRWLSPGADSLATFTDSLSRSIRSQWDTNFGKYQTLSVEHRQKLLIETSLFHCHRGAPTN